MFSAYLYKIIYFPLFSISLCACESLTYSGLKLKQSEISPLSNLCLPITQAFLEMQLFKQAGVISKFLFFKILSLYKLTQSPANTNSPLLENSYKSSSIVKSAGATIFVLLIPS